MKLGYIEYICGWLLIVLGITGVVLCFTGQFSTGLVPKCLLAGFILGPIYLIRGNKKIRQAKQKKLLDILAKIGVQVKEK